MSNSQSKIEDFWLWFQSHRSQFAAIQSAAEPFWDVALEQIKRIDDHLWFELSQAGDATREFIVTAEGHKEVFPLVDEIIIRAPKIDGWEFIALKPPMGFDFVTTYEGIRFDPSEMWFLPLKSTSSSKELWLRVALPGLKPANQRQAENAVLVILDTALGERVAASNIGRVEVANLPNAPGSEGYIELKKLPAYIAQHKQ